MDAAPDEYQAIVNTEQRAKGDKITLQDLAETMDQQWRSLYGQRNNKIDCRRRQKQHRSGTSNLCWQMPQLSSSRAQGGCLPTQEKHKQKQEETSANNAAIVAKWDTSRQIVGIDQRTPTSARNGTNHHI